MTMTTTTPMTEMPPSPRAIVHPSLATAPAFADLVARIEAARADYNQARTDHRNAVAARDAALTAHRHAAATAAADGTKPPKAPDLDTTSILDAVARGTVAADALRLLAQRLSDAVLGDVGAAYAADLKHQRLELLGSARAQLLAVAEDAARADDAASVAKWLAACRRNGRIMPGTTPVRTTARGFTIAETAAALATVIDDAMPATEPE